MLLSDAFKRELKKLISAFKYYKCIKEYGVVVLNSTVSTKRVFFERKAYINSCSINNYTTIHSNSTVVDCHLMGYNKIGKSCGLINSTIGKYSYIADNSNINNTTIGNFCSIGPDFKCGYGMHPINRISTSPFFYSSEIKYNPFHPKDSSFKEYDKIIIGHDVWIGANVFIKDGVHVGNGAIIGAGSIVIKDVPEFTIVGGVPAKVIRLRYSEEVIEALKKVNWWDKDEEWLQLNVASFCKEITTTDNLIFSNKLS